MSERKNWREIWSAFPGELAGIAFIVIAFAIVAYLAGVRGR